jgi:hypothetical protein
MLLQFIVMKDTFQMLKNLILADFFQKIQETDHLSRLYHSQLAEEIA